MSFIPTASRTQAAIEQTGASVTSLKTKTAEAAAAEGVIGNIGITQASGSSVDVTEASSATMLQKLESIRAVLADGNGVNIAIQNMDVDLDNLETILNGSTLANSGSAPTYVTNTLINNIKTAVEKLDNAIITLGQAVGTAEATLVAGTDGTNLRGLLTDNTGKLQEANSSSIKTAVEKLDDTVNSNDQLDVNIADGGFDGVVTNTVLTSLDDAINNSKVDVNISTGGFDGAITLPPANLSQRNQAASLSVTLASDDDLQTCVNTTDDRLKVQIDSGGFDGAVTNASNTQLAVTTVQSAVYTDQVTVSQATNGAAVGTTQALKSGITVVADSANTATVYVGGTTGLSATTGFPLAAGAGFTFSLDDRAALFAFTTSANQKINYVAM